MPKIQSTPYQLEQSDTAWQRILQELGASHALQSWVWGEFKSRWGWSAERFSFYDPNESQDLIAAAQVLERQIPNLSQTILYAPKGPLIKKEQQGLNHLFLGQLEALARKKKAIFIKIDPEIARYWGSEKGRQSETGAQFVQELEQRGWRFSTEQIQFRNTVELDLTLPEDELLAGMKSKTRYNIRLAGRKGVTVRKGTADDFPLFASMYQETAQRDQFTIRPIEYYLDAWNAFYQAGMALPLIAEYEEQPLAALIVIREADRAIYMYGASTNRERKRMPNYLLQWEAIRWAKNQSCTTYDFWGAPNEFVESDPLWGVWRFKDGFQGQVVWHIGAWDYVVRPFWYWAYTQILPRYLNFLRSRN